MKCKHCGAEIGLEENYCRYCGQPNDQALRHTQDMTNYHRRYAATETAVVSRTKRYSQIILRAALILVILIATIVMYLVAENAYSIPETIRRREANRNPKKTIAASMAPPTEKRLNIFLSLTFLKASTLLSIS